MIGPTVHNNGTSREELKLQLKNSYVAIRTAIKALQAGAPNGRDYYPQGPEAFSIAREEHVSRIARLEEVNDELHCLLMVIDTHK